MAKKNQSDSANASKSPVATLEPPVSVSSPTPVDPNADTVVLPALGDALAGEGSFAAESARRTSDGVSGRANNVLIELPVGPDGGYVTRGFRRDLPPDQAALCRRVINQLNADGVKLRSGRTVETPDDVLCYVLEQIDRSIANFKEPRNGTQQRSDRVGR